MFGRNPFFARNSYNFLLTHDLNLSFVGLAHKDPSLKCGLLLYLRNILKLKSLERSLLAKSDNSFKRRTFFPPSLGTCRIILEIAVAIFETVALMIFLLRLLNHADRLIG